MTEGSLLENHKHQKPNHYLRKGALVMVLGMIGGYAADYLFNLTLARLLSTKEYGDYKVAHAFAVIAGVIVLLGGDRAAPKFLSAQLAKSDNSGVLEYLWFYLRIALVLSFVVVLLTFIGFILHLGASGIDDHHPILKASLVVPFLAAGAMLSRLLQSAKYLATSNLPWRIGLPVLKLSFAFLVYSLCGTLNVSEMIAGAGLSALLICAWQWKRSRQLGLISFKSNVGKQNSVERLKISIPMMLVMLVGLAMSQIDLFMLELLGNEEGVGHYAAAAVTAHVILIAQVTITGLFTPLIAPAIEQGVQSAKYLFWTGQKLITLTVIFLAVCLMFFGSTLLQFFGNDFLDAKLPLKLLTIAYLFWALTAFASTWMQYTGKGGLIVIITCSTLLINIVSNAYLIPRYGLDGGAIATTISMAFASISIGISHFRYTNVQWQKSGGDLEMAD